MAYANCNIEVEVDSSHRAPTSEAAEFMHGNDPELLQFLGQHQFLSLDAAFVRVVENTIDTLIAKKLIHITDLPLRALSCWQESFRDRASRHSLLDHQENEV